MQVTTDKVVTAAVVRCEEQVGGKQRLTTSTPYDDVEAATDAW
jgi:hypothetical protein